MIFAKAVFNVLREGNFRGWIYSLFGFCIQVRQVWLNKLFKPVVNFKVTELVCVKDDPISIVHLKGLHSFKRNG